MSQATPDLLPDLVLEFRQALTPLAGEDWTLLAPDLDWSCHQTAVHIADSFFAQAAQITARAKDGFIPAEIAVSPDVPPLDVLQTIEACAGLLQAAACCADPDLTAWHPFGSADPSGWVAMGIVEGLVHTWDISTAFGGPWEPPAELCRPAIERLFPDAPPGFPAADTLLWSTGRIALDGWPRQGPDWRWQSAPSP